jgi:hypothetical protein
MTDAGVAQPAAPLVFSYSRVLAPPLWAFACIMAVELVVVHILVSSLWSRTAAATLSTLSLAALAWTILFIRSLKRLPVLVDGEGVTMRVGSLKSVHLGWDRVAGVRTSWPAEALRQRTVLNLALINYPNVMLDLDPPFLTRRRSLQAVAHRLDDPAGFVAAIGALIHGGKSGEQAPWSIA